MKTKLPRPVGLDIGDSLQRQFDHHGFTSRTAPSDPMTVSWGREPGAWAQMLDGKTWGLAIFPFIQCWPGSTIRDPSGKFISAAIAYVDVNRIGETDICAGSDADRVRKGKWSITLDIAGTCREADARLELARELTSKGGTIAILAPVVWCSKMLLDVGVEPAVHVLDERIGGRTVAWFVWDRRGFMGKWHRLAKGT